MKVLMLSVMLVVGASSAAVYAAEGDSATTYVKDSVITTKVKSKLAAKHMSTLSDINVDTDANGSV